MIKWLLQQAVRVGASSETGRAAAARHTARSSARSSLECRATDPDTALAVLLHSGVVCLPDALSGPLLEECQAHASRNFAEVISRYESTYPRAHGGFAELCAREGGRYDMRHKMLQHPFNSAELVYNPSWYPVVAKALGEPLTLLYSGVMFARALQDAEPQGWHADGEQLCPDVGLPPHCLNVFVPLVELTPENGSTEFCPGTHIAGAEDLEDKPTFGMYTPAGSAIIFDYRIQHRGAANRCVKDRPMLYLVYAKPWFRDHANHRSRVQLFPEQHPPTTRTLHSTDLDARGESSDDSGEKWVLFTMDLRLPDDKLIDLEICQGDQPLEVAHAVVTKYSLDESMIAPLAAEINHRMVETQQKPS